MKVLRSLSRIPRFPGPVVAALGVFDGVHVGHRFVLRQAVEKARASRGTSVAVTFWPHPQGQSSLHSLTHRLALLQELGIDAVVVIPFNRKFASMSGEEFARTVLSGKIRARWVFVGGNFRFGRNASGTPALLSREGGKYGFSVKAFPVVRRGGAAVSSTRIRSLITAGKLGPARSLLGRQVSVLGTVVRGYSVGRTLGFPTANLDPHHEVVPPDGIYAVRAYFSGREYPAACYIGTRPTFSGKGRPRRSIEVHLFGFKGDVYGRDMEIRFVKRVRADRKFPSTQALIAQIAHDLSACRTILSR